MERNVSKDNSLIDKVRQDINSNIGNELYSVEHFK